MENPFLDEKEEEEYVVHKPLQKETLTEAQKKRNFKGLDMVKEALRKVGLNIRDYKKEVNRWEKK